MRNTLLRGVLWLTVVAGFVQAKSLQSGPMVKLRTLESQIPHVELTSGPDGIGGATIEDAVTLLRRLTAFPINIETREYTRERDGLTLAAALVELRELKAKQSLTPPDEARLKIYEELATAEDASTVVGFKKRTLALTRDQITVRAFLDSVTQLDRDYVWKNYGTETAPLVVLQPREKSDLEWHVPAICGERLSSVTLYGSGSKLTALFEAHKITRMGLNGSSRVPDVQLDLCRDGLIARDVLNLTVQAVGDGASWSVSGIKGLRWLSFQ